MNNKGFAITGILYTLLILFTMILLSVLATMSVKKTTLEKTIIGLEDSYKLKDLGEIKTETSSDKVLALDGTVLLNNRIPLISGKYEFILKTGTSIETVKCVTYLKKGQKIPLYTGPDQEELFSPRDCNSREYEISLNTSEEVNNKLILKKVYKFEG